MIQSLHYGDIVAMSPTRVTFVNHYACESEEGGFLIEFIAPQSKQACSGFSQLSSVKLTGSGNVRHTLVVDAVHEVNNRTTSTDSRWLCLIKFS